MYFTIFSQPVELKQKMSLAAESFQGINSKKTIVDAIGFIEYIISLFSYTIVLLPKVVFETDTVGPC